MKLYLKYFSIQIRSILEYKTTFIISIVSQMFTSILGVLSIMFLFNKFGNINNYQFGDILICFATSFMGFSISECFFRAFDHFDRMIGNGEFDRILVRPRNLILQVLGSKIEFVKMGRAIASLFIFIGILAYRPEILRPDKFITLILMILGTIVIYSAMFLLKAAICFFTTQSLEIMNIFTDGARDLAEYPLDIYQEWVKKFFTFILPLALVNYYPLLYVIGKTDNKIFAILPLFSILFVIQCYIVWKIGLSKYRSTGS